MSSKLVYRTACGSFLPVLYPVVIPGLHAGTCAVLRGSSLIVCKQVRLSFL